MSILSRRAFLTRSLLACSVYCLPPLTIATERPVLSIPPLLDIRKGKPLLLNFSVAQKQFKKGNLVEVWGVNGQYLSPTVRIKAGDFVRLNYINNLPQPLAINVQGLLVSTNMFGSPYRILEPKSSWSPIIFTKQTACTCFYHANTLFNSAYQTYRGIAGMWIIDESVKTGDLPDTYGVNDIPLILQDQQINEQGVQLLDIQSAPFLGKKLLVNGQESPYMVVPQGWLRLRIINASLSRCYELSLNNDQSFYLIATGIAMFSEALEMKQLRLAPAERVEILINVTERVSLITDKKRNFLDSVSYLFTQHNQLNDNTILDIRPEGLISVFSQQPKLPSFNYDEFKLTVKKERRFILHPSSYLINQRRFDPKRIDCVVKYNSVERWFLNSSEDCCFNIQGAKFIIETVERQPFPFKQLVWRDSVWLEKNKEYSILIYFNQLASEELPFTFGISDFILRDKGCMGQFSVTE